MRDGQRGFLPLVFRMLVCSSLEQQSANRQMAGVRGRMQRRHQNCGRAGPCLYTGNPTSGTPLSADEQVVLCVTYNCPEYSHRLQAE